MSIAYLIHRTSFKCVDFPMLLLKIVNNSTLLCNLPILVLWIKSTFSFVKMFNTFAYKLFYLSILWIIPSVIVKQQVLNNLWKNPSVALLLSKYSNTILIAAIRQL